jgi:hypothetical protein
MTIVIRVRDDSKRVVRVGDGYDVVTSFHPVQHRRILLVALAASELAGVAETP